jgi:hypothetical protein
MITVNTQGSSRNVFVFFGCGQPLHPGSDKKLLGRQAAVTGKFTE